PRRRRGGDPLPRRRRRPRGAGADHEPGAQSTRPALDRRAHPARRRGRPGRRGDAHDRRGRERAAARRTSRLEPRQDRARGVASLFSGLHPRSHGVFGVPREWAAPAGAAPDTEWGYLADAIPTLADQLRRAGITTVGVSANPLVSAATNLDRGFETFAQLDAT